MARAVFILPRSCAPGRLCDKLFSQRRSARGVSRRPKSNWAVEGFTATQNRTAQRACYIATSSTSATLHHIAFVNDIAINCIMAAFGTYSWTSPGGRRSDRSCRRDCL